MDNFYNSPALAPRLKSLKTDRVGTLRLSRKEAKERRNGSSTFRPGVRSEVERQKRRDNDFDLPWTGNKIKLMKCRQEKQKPVSVLDYNENIGGVDLKDQLLQLYLLERKKMTKCYIKLFRRLLNITVLNCMVICCANSGQTKRDHFKFRAELVQALTYLLHGAESFLRS